MEAHGDAMMLVRAELCDRLETLRRLSARSKGRDFAESLDGIRRLAAAYGLDPVARLAGALERAVGECASQDPRHCPSALYLARIEDAIGCERLDDAASEAMIASVSVRFA